MAPRKPTPFKSNPVGPGSLHAMLFDDLRAFRRFLDANSATPVSEREQAGLKALWEGRVCADIAKRNRTSLWVYDDTELEAVADWRYEHPDVEFMLIREVENLESDPGANRGLAAFMKSTRMHGTDAGSVIKGYTYPRKSGRVSVDFSDMEALGWPASWSFPARWTFEFNRTRIKGLAVFEVILLQVECDDVGEAA